MRKRRGNERHLRKCRKYKGGRKRRDIVDVKTIKTFSQIYTWAEPIRW